MPLAPLPLLALALAGLPGDALTCDPAELDPRSVALVTSVQARIVSEPRYRWTDAFVLGAHEESLAALNASATGAAERALELDPRSLAARAVLARQYVIEEDPERAQAMWRAVADAGGAVAWTATLYEVDPRSYFVFAFDAEGVRVYRMGALVDRLETGFHGIPRFPGPEEERFWRALAGCVDPAARPEARIPWSDVTEIKARNSVLEFRLARRFAIRSDRGESEEVSRFKVALHGRTGELEVYQPVGEERLALRGRGPFSYQELARRMMVDTFDRERRIRTPAVRPGAGW